MISPERAKHLTVIAQQCFDAAIGNSQRKATKEDIVFFHTVLTAMIDGYIEANEQQSHTEIKLVIGSQCPRCGNSEIGLVDRNCKICGLPLFVKSGA